MSGEGIFRVNHGANAWLTVFAFPPSQLGVWARSPSGNRTVPSAAAEALAATGARAALDAVMFDRCDASGLSGSDAQQYAQSRCSQPRYALFDPARGVAVAGRSPGDGCVFAVAGGLATVTRGSAVPAGAAVAAQLYPPLVLDGANVASNAGENAEAVWRAGAGVLTDGRVAFAVGAADMVTFAGWLLDAGFFGAGYTDGGGSTRMALSTGQVFGASENRRVAAWLIALPEPGGLTLAEGAVATAAAAALYRAWKGRWPWQRGGT